MTGSLNLALPKWAMQMGMHDNAAMASNNASDKYDKN